MTRHLPPDPELKRLARKADYEVSALAALLGISERTLERCFDDDLRVSPKAWLDELFILQEAVPLVVQGMKVEAIARKLGYATVQGFSRAFHRVTGETPTAFYRKALRRKNVG